MTRQMTIDVCMVSWPNHPKRIEYLLQVLAALQDKLVAQHHNLRLYCSLETERDDRSSWHGDEAAALLTEYEVTFQWRDGPANLGANMNAAMRMGTGEFVFLQQDDWCLTHPLNLSEGADLLQKHPKLDIVRYCWPETDSMRPTFRGDLDGWRLIDPRGNWPYGDDPHLRRRDFMDKWGWYLEGGKHGSASGDLMYKIANQGGCSVVADHLYYSHKGRVSAVLGDTRSGASRRYENA